MKMRRKGRKEAPPLINVRSEEEVRGGRKMGGKEGLGKPAAEDIFFLPLPLNFKVKRRGRLFSLLRSRRRRRRRCLRED